VRERKRGQVQLFTSRPLLVLDLSPFLLPLHGPGMVEIKDLDGQLTRTRNDAPVALEPPTDSLLFEAGIKEESCGPPRRPARFAM